MLLILAILKIAFILGIISTCIAVSYCSHCSFEFPNSYICGAKHETSKSAAPAPRVTAIRANITDDDGQDIWMWPISEDEGERLTAMLGQDFYDLNIEGTYVNTPITQCPECGKDNELVDWCFCLSPQLARR